MRTLKLWSIAGLVALAAVGLGGCGSSAQSTHPATSAPGAVMATAMPVSVSVNQASTLRDGGAFILDVREPGEYAAGHIPGATLIPLGELARRTNEVPRAGTVVVVCHSGNRSAQGRDVLRQAGFTNVTSMAGGMTEWSAADLPITKGT